MMARLAKIDGIVYEKGIDDAKFIFSNDSANVCSIDYKKNPKGEYYFCFEIAEKYRAELEERLS